MKKTNLLFMFCCLLSLGLMGQSFTGGGNPQSIPMVGTGGFPCVGGPTESVANVVGVNGSIGANVMIQEVRINLTHTFDSDLEIDLISPAGTIWDLSSDNGGAGDDMIMTVFADGNPSIITGSAPFTGSFEAEEGPLNDGFAGEAANGDWTLSICDDAGGDSGQLTNFEIEFMVIPVTIFDIVSDLDGTSTLEDALIAAGLDVTLSAPAPPELTLFAPTNAAFDNLPEDIAARIASDDAYRDEVLAYHVLAGEVLSTALTDGQTATTLQGEDITVTIDDDGNIFINDAEVTLADIDVDNGVVHLIDQVLIPPSLEPVYEVSLAAIEEVNVTLNDNCEAVLIPQMILVGNYDVDGDEFPATDNLFEITVLDNDPTNGPIIDGCGTWQWQAVGVTPSIVDPVTGFVGDFDASNWAVVNTASNGNQVADADFTATELTLSTESLVFSTGSPFGVSASYTFPSAGVLSFSFDYNGIDPGFDDALIIVDEEGQVIENILNTDQPADGEVVVEIEAGYRLLASLQDDGFQPFAGQFASELVISEFEFDGEDVTDEIVGFTTAWGFVNAEDKTSPIAEFVPVAPEELFCSELDEVNVNTLPQSISRCWVADGRTGATLNSSMDPQLRESLIAGGGIPRFFDGCSDVTICVNDVVDAPDACEDVVITRVFTATDGSCPSAAGESNPAAVASYEITFSRPSLDDVEGVPALAEFSCVDFDANDPNPLPEADDFPFLVRANGDEIFLGESFCNIGATYEDGPRITTCANTYKFIRTYTVVDWCDVGNSRTFTQLVKVGDFTAPVITAPTQDLDFDGNPDDGPLFYSTNSLDCTSFFVIPAGFATDDCDETPTVSVVVFAFGDEESAPIGPFAVGELAGGFPIGIHLLRYTATDDCGNESSIDVEFEVGDRTAPVAICEDGLNISIGGAGVAVITAENIDRASYDECSDVSLTIACVDANNNNTTPYLPSLTVTCDDLGIKRIGLRVEDAEGNVNFCWLDVLIEDKTAPVCVAPGPVTVTCADLDGDFPADLNALFASDPDGTAALLDEEFGAAVGLDNCPDVGITQTVVDNRNSCGVGTITRRFTATDGQGFVSPPNCSQLITVLAVHDYTIVFPADEGSDECVEPDYSAVTFDERGCDLITISTSIDTFTATADECYKLRITYEVLNWCEYNTEDDPYLIPRDADNDNILEEATYLHILPRSVSTLSDDVAILDRDNDPSNANTIAYLDNQDVDVLNISRGGTQDGTNPQVGYGLDGSRGAFIYQQFIKVYDDVAPTLVVTQPTEAFCDEDGDCIDDAELGFSIEDECSPASVDATVELDAFIDAGADDIYTLADFVADGGDVTGNTTNNGDGTFTVNLTDLPIGVHAIRIAATDGCGNTSLDLIVFEITDCKAPTPICINGLTATLMPDGEGGGMAAIWASDFIASPSEDCSGEVKFAIYTSEEASQPGFAPNVADVGIDLTCADLGMLPVRIYAIDPFGQADYCETTVFVQAFQDGVCGGDGSLAGVISTPNDDMMTGVEVNISDAGNTNNTEMTANGLYQFTDLVVGEDYTVQPTHDPSVNLATVSTGDLILISRHILGLQELTGPYQLFAADVTLEGSINVLDIIAIRRVILGLDASFQNTASWQFYVAGDDTYQQVYNVNNLPGSIVGADFVAVEMGNVSDAIANFQAPVQQRSALGLNVEDQDLVAGNVYEVTFSAAEMAGFQGTLEIAAGLELVDVNYALVEAGNFNLSQAANGLVAMSYNGEAGELFTLNVRATVDAKLSDMVSISDRITVAEAYTNGGGIANLGINFSAAPTVAAEFGLEQNTPNPFADVTQIGFRLPAAGQATLTVQDVQGRTLLVRQLEGNAGYNTTDLNTADLKGATGVLSYTIVAGDFTATRKMVVVQ